MARFLVRKALHIEGLGYTLVGNITQGAINAGDTAVIEYRHIQIKAVKRLKEINNEMHAALQISDDDKERIKELKIIGKQIDIIECSDGSWAEFLDDWDFFDDAGSLLELFDWD